VVFAASLVFFTLAAGPSDRPIDDRRGFLGRSGFLTAGRNRSCSRDIPFCGPHEFPSTIGVPRRFDVWLEVRESQLPLGFHSRASSNDSQRSPMALTYFPRSIWFRTLPLPGDLPWSLLVSTPCLITTAALGFRLEQTTFHTLDRRWSH